MPIRFGEFILDTDRRELLRNAIPVSLPPKVFQLLEILVERRPKAVAQQELYDRLWPDTFVEKGNLHNLIYQLREALGDKDQTSIRTVYGFGFSFAAAGAENPPPASWQVVIGDQEFDLREGENIVGRERNAAVRIDAPSISRYHARIVVTSDGVSVEDLGSKNGTMVEGRKIHAAHALRDGDRIIFGTVAAALRAVPNVPSTETAR
jgi:DNA-binding winged helix-turn-helix (wHTH) protein